MKREHFAWIDVAKAFGIVAVVAGHGGNEMIHHYTYWFHMPLFFMLSGFLYKTPEGFHMLPGWVWKRAVRLLLPYLSFGILIYLYIELKAGFTIEAFIDDMYSLAYGGLMMKGLVTVFWFITCLFIIQVVFVIIDLLFKKEIWKIGLMVLSYLFAHYYIANVQMEMPVPWSADVAFIAITYYAFGYYLKKYIHLVLNLKVFIISAALTLTFIAYDYWNGFFYSIDLKPNVYNHLLLDFLVPVIICFTIFYISDVLAKTKLRMPLSQIGASAITIMFLHRVANDFFTHFFEYEIVMYTVIGVGMPYLFYLCVRDIPVVQLMLLGDAKRKQRNINRKSEIKRAI